MRAHGWVFGVSVAGGAAFLFGGCANAPAGIERMSAAQLQMVPEGDLCFAYAFAIKTRRQSPNALREVHRRGLDCDIAISETVSNCAQLSILNPAQQPIRDERVPYDQMTPYVDDVVFYSVRNLSDKAFSFRISWDMRLTKVQRVEPLATEDYMVEVPQIEERSYISKKKYSGKSIIPRVQECVVVK